jgi:hypothetical protein
MWTPLILICYLGTAECAVPAAPTYATEAECQQAIQGVLLRMTLAPNLRVRSYTCHNWGSGA